MPLDETDYVRLARFLSGQMSPDEEAECARWIAQNAEREAVAVKMRGVWAQASAPAADDWDAEGALRRIKGGRAAARPTVVHFPVSRAYTERLRRDRRTASVARIAAGLLLLAGGAGLWPRHTPAPRVATPTPVAMSEVVTRRAERASVRLTDGTRITMAPGTTLRYAQTFGQRERRVYLDGQALFAVAHDSARPFRVYTSRGVATDIGTRFVVRAYGNEHRLDVAVAEGAVSLRGARDSAAPFISAPVARDSILLTAGAVGRVGANNVPRARRNADVDRYLAWTEGRLVFQDTPLPEALAEIGRWYDVEVHIASPALARAHVTASYRDESLSGALQSIAVATGAHYERVGRTVRFTLRRSSP